MDAHAREAAALGGALAESILNRPHAVDAPPVPPGLITLLAEGDSWFDYPFHDVLKLLEEHHGYTIESVARHGDPIEAMAYGDGQLDALARALDRLIDRGRPPRALLLSGGGNDLTGTVFGSLLDHARSPTAGLNALALAGIVDVRVRGAFLTILGAVTHLARRRLGRPLPILLHGYDSAVADGRGFLGGWGALPGPWLEPGFREKGFADPAARLRIVRQLVDRLNMMLAALAALPEWRHVHYIDLRGTLPTGSDYADWWGNELHPTRDGFARVAAQFDAVLRRCV